MAAFLSGLMGALQNVGAGLGNGMSKVGRGLMGAIDPAMSSAPGGMARQAGTGGLLPAIADITAKDSGRFRAYADPTLDDPISRTLGRDVMQRMPTLETKPQGSFLDRLREVDDETGLSQLDKFDRFGARLQDITEGGDRAADVDKLAAGRLAKRRQAALASQIDSLFPDDARMRFLLKANPEKATEALASVYQKEREPYTLSKGQVRGQGGERVDAMPDYGVEDGTPWMAGEEGFEWGRQRPRTWQEMETERANRADEEVARGNLGVSRGRLDWERTRPRGGAGADAGAALPPLPPGFRRVQ